MGHPKSSFCKGLQGTLFGCVGIGRITLSITLSAYLIIAPRNVTEYDSIVINVVISLCCAPFNVLGPKVAPKGPKTRWRQKMPKEKNYIDVITTY